MLYYGSVAEGLACRAVSDETWEDVFGGRYGAGLHAGEDEPGNSTP